LGVTEQPKKEPARRPALSTVQAERQITASRRAVRDWREGQIPRSGVVYWAMRRISAAIRTKAVFSSAAVGA